MPPSDRQPLSRDQLAAFRSCGRLDPFAWHFAETVCRLAPGDAPDGLLAAAALAAQSTVVRKHVCLSLSPGLRLADLLTPDTEPDGAPPDAAFIRPAELAALLRSDACSFAVAVDPQPEAAPFKPLVLEADRLYLQRYWLCENTLARLLNARAASPPATPPADGALRASTRLPLDAAQTAAVRQASAGRLTVITGGPGTGKTTIVSVVLAALLRENPALDIRLCAPTGKAQARLKEALDHEINAHPLTAGDPGLNARLRALETATLHRLLKARPPLDRFAFNAGNPLPADVLIVDEASMVDLSLMTHLLTAVSTSCRVILLGDSDQLAAVDTGAVLAEICDAWDGRPAVARPTRSHRFDPERGIGRLKDAVNGGAPGKAWDILSGGGAEADCPLSPAPATYAACEQALARHLERHPFRGYLRADTPEAAFPRFDAFRILCATRHGPCGADHVNRCVQTLLGVAPYGHGYPLMVTVNDYARRLFNGDIGLCLRQPGGGETRVWFPDIAAPGAYRSFTAAELPEHAPVFAMTVHKAQGSGFDDVLLILPPRESPVLTRELLYTGLTRAKTRCAIWADRPAFTAAVERRTRRMSGLKDKLARGM
jgi:exodeoxyribonuclease V alpha subunit